MSLVDRVVPLDHSVTVTGSDTVDLAQWPTQGILVDTSGTLKVSYPNGTTDTMTLTAGIWHSMAVRRIWSTGTSATGLHAGYNTEARENW